MNKYKFGSDFCMAMQDIILSCQRWSLVWFLAISNIKARYRRSALGPFWLTIAAAVGTVGLGFLWSELLKVPRSEFIPSLTAGLITWQLISGTVSDGVNAFNHQAPTIRNTQQPYFIHPLQKVLTHFLNYLHALPVFILVMLILPVTVSWYSLWFFPCLILLLLNLTWIALFLGVLGSRFRDLEFIINMAIPLLFFISPVMFRPHQVEALQKLLWLNPVTPLIELIRAPMLGHGPDNKAVAACLVMLFVGWLLALFIFAAKRKRIAFWV